MKTRIVILMALVMALAVAGAIFATNRTAEAGGTPFDEFNESQCRPARLPDGTTSSPPRHKHRGARLYRRRRGIQRTSCSCLVTG